MKTYKIEIVEPKAKRLIEELVNLKLIKIQEVDSPKQEFKKLLDNFRDKKGSKPGLEEITKEVDLVRKKRFDEK